MQVKRYVEFIVMTVVSVAALSAPCMATESIINVPGNIYEFEEKDNYPISSYEAIGSATSGDTLGIFSITGFLSDSGLIDGKQSYTVSSGNIAFSYAFDSAILDAEETDWHLTDDKTKKVDDFTLDSNILSGAIIVQSSNDGETYLTDVELTDIFEAADTLDGSIYTSKDIQLENGCYYRVIVAYKLEIKTGEKKIAVVTTDVTEQKRCAEVYEFYAVSGETGGNAASAADIPRKEIAGNPTRTGRNNGYSGEEPIDKSDPHFGWNLGSFIINGYTRETIYNGSPVYLKNVEDKVTLWFTLFQDINSLNGDDTLSINEDNNGYDLDFKVAQTDFGRGALIIRFTDHEGKTHDPIIYTDFLAANARTGADTRVQLFEEGDYDVTLDYEIKNNPRQIGPVSVVPTYTDYKIAFSFSIRNGNCMIYPFDISSGNELSDNAITANGFELDLAKSRYLDIDVERTVLNIDSNGFISEDVRFNRPAKDGDSYTDEGIYTFTVSNLYTGATTTKVIYVGTDKYLAALSKNILTVEALNAKIAAGYVLKDDGSLSSLDDSKTEQTAEAVTEDGSEEEIENRAGSTADEILSETAIIQSDAPEALGSSGLAIPVVILILVIAAGVSVVIMKKKKSGNEKEGGAA